jgi:hypothetical protein
MSGTSHPATQRNMLEVPKPQFNQTESLTTRQAVYVQRNIVARSYSHCCSGKTISITCCECVFVAFGIQHAMRMRHIVICDLRGSTIFFHSRKGQGFSERVQNETCVLIFSTSFVRHISHSKKNWTRKIYLGLRVKYPNVIPVRFKWNFNFLYRFSKKKNSNIKFHKNPSSGSRDVSSGWTVGQTDMTKIIVAFGNFANVPKNSQRIHASETDASNHRHVRNDVNFAWRTHSDSSRRTYSIELSMCESSLSFDVYLKILVAYLVRCKKPYRSISLTCCAT